MKNKSNIGQKLPPPSPALKANIEASKLKYNEATQSLIEERDKFADAILLRDYEEADIRSQNIKDTIKSIAQDLLYSQDKSGKDDEFRYKPALYQRRVMLNEILENLDEHERNVDIPSYIQEVDKAEERIKEVIWLADFYGTFGLKAVLPYKTNQLKKKNAKSKDKKRADNIKKHLKKWQSYVVTKRLDKPSSKIVHDGQTLADMLDSQDPNLVPPMYGNDTFQNTDSYETSITEDNEDTDIDIEQSDEGGGFSSEYNEIGELGGESHPQIYQKNFTPYIHMQENGVSLNNTKELSDGGSEEGGVGVEGLYGDDGEDTEQDSGGDVDGGLYGVVGEGEQGEEEWEDSGSPVKALSDSELVRRQVSQFAKDFEEDEEGKAKKKEWMESEEVCFSADMVAASSGPVSYHDVLRPDPFLAGDLMEQKGRVNPPALGILDYPDLWMGDKRRVMGADIARYGSDKTVLAIRYGMHVVDIQAFAKQDTVETVGRILSAIEEWKIEEVVIDITGGLGASVLDMLRKSGIIYTVRFTGVAFNEVPRSNRLCALNKRAEMFLLLQEKLGQGEISLPSDEELLEELVYIRYEYTFSGDGDKLRISPKDKTKKELGRSPDKADAVALSFYSNSGMMFY